MTHELKIQKQWADAKLAGEKPFEIRRNDRGFQKGDIVRYRVIDPKTGEPWVEPGFHRLVTNGNGVGKKYVSGRHPLEFCDFLITYVREGADGLERGYCVFADCPVPKKALEGPEGPARAHGEAYSEGFMRITKDGLNAMEKALEECRRTPSAPPVVPSECGYYEPDDSSPATGERPCKHYMPEEDHTSSGPGTCSRIWCDHWLRECPTYGCKYPATSSASSPVSADLGSGTTPSNGPAEPLAPPPPLAETSDREVHTDVKSVPKSSEGCKDFAGKFNGICRFAYATTPSWAFSCGCKTSANYGKRCPIE